MKHLQTEKTSPRKKKCDILNPRRYKIQFEIQNIQTKLIYTNLHKSIKQNVYCNFFIKKYQPKS